MKNSNSKPEYGNVYFLDKRTNETKSKFDKISRDLRYILRANDRNKRLSKAARSLVSNYYDMISKNDNKVIFIDSEFISGITEVGVRQNNNIHKELSDIFRIQYHQVVRIENKRYRDGFTIECTENTHKILENPESFYTNNREANVDAAERNFRSPRKKFPRL